MFSSRFLVPAVLLLLTGCTDSKTTFEPITQKTETPAPVVAEPHEANEPAIQLPAADAPIVKVTAAELYADIRAGDDQVARYAKSWVDVSGELFNIDVVVHDATGEKILTMAIAPPSNGGLGSTDICVCQAADGEQPWKQTQPRSEVTLRGALTEEGGFHHLVACRIIDTKGAPVPEFTVDELRARLQEDPPGMAEQFSPSPQKSLILMGQFAGRIAPENAEDKSSWVAIDGADKQRVFGYTGSFNMRAFEGLQPGDDVTVMAVLSIPSAEQALTTNLNSTINLTPFAREKPATP
ncbi:hypothetical protein [Lignipirellula cremea]|uniref:Uncharacterized protein n=1 Tax=Lignipirellula cremea TaxID=2528010 RepID=A0A518DWY6_9BACT|nr:hypothetical protein [Lignipirellula cremea]QDU96347.1 hypothetical protein Pla8534_41670 [Lignipirellula cremea]